MFVCHALEKGKLYMIRQRCAGLSGWLPVENSEFEGCDLVIFSLVVAIPVLALLLALGVGTNDFIYPTDLIST